MEFVKTILIAVISGAWVSKITNDLQGKSFLNQIKIKHAEIEVDTIINLCTNLIKNSNYRRYTAKILIDSITYNYTKNTSLYPHINELRKEYKESVKTWNTELPQLYIKLSNCNLYPCALQIEEEIHNKFRESHELIKNYLIHPNNIQLSNISIHLDSIYSKTMEITNKLIEKSKERKNKILNGNTENLSIHNIQYAPLWKLIIAIFHPTPDKLRITRSS